jgi:hypothetical protein
MGECVVCEKETNNVLFSDAIVGLASVLKKCLKEYFKPIRREVRLQKKLKESNGWLD